MDVPLLDRPEMLPVPWRMRSPLVLLAGGLLFGVYLMNSSVLFVGHFAATSVDLPHAQKSVGLVGVHVNGPSTSKRRAVGGAESCELPPIDPWDPLLAAQVARDSRPKPRCVPQSKIRTKLANGRLEFIDKTAPGELCEWRCLLINGVGQLRGGHWRPFDLEEPNAPQCDIVDVRCSMNETITYQFLHTQLYERPLQRPAEEPNTMPDIHVIVLDSVSMSLARRALPKTLRFLEERLGAQTFSHLNKIGLNSMPNQFPMLFGFAVGGERLVPFQRERVFDNKPQRFCDQPGRPSRFLLARLKRRNYTTMFNEDWSSKFFSEERCSPPAAAPVDHFFGPFFARKYQLWPELKRTTARSSHRNDWAEFCIKKHVEMLDHLEQFVRAYPQRPKASLSWFTYLAHDKKSEVYQTDDNFLQFFERNEKQFENSFVFFMADHGSRLYDSTSIPVDRMEDNNPLLSVVFPRKLREDARFMEQIGENKQELVTHFDVYSTFMDIADNLQSLQSSAFSSADFFASTYRPASRRGSSLFRPLPQPRNCRSLSIPWDYCNCRQRTEAVEDARLAGRLARAAVGEMNRSLRSARVLAAFCSRLRVDERENPPVVERILTNETADLVFSFTFHTLPGDGLYSGLATRNSRGELRLLTRKFPRQNAYAQQSSCLLHRRVDHFYQNYCVCKGLFSKELP